MKKLLSVAAAALLAMAVLAGCNTTAQQSEASDTAVLTTQSGSEENTDTDLILPENYEKTFDGFVQYMTDYNFISGEGTDLTASAIGAKEGKRYTVSLGTTRFFVELYMYEDTSSELAVKTIENARKDGSFHLYDSTESATRNTLAAVSEDGRFLMLYTDASENEKNIALKNAAADAVKQFSK